MDNAGTGHAPVSPRSSPQPLHDTPHAMVINPLASLRHEPPQATVINPLVGSWREASQPSPSPHERLSPRNRPDETAAAPSSTGASAAGDGSVDLLSESGSSAYLHEDPPPKLGPQPIPSAADLKLYDYLVIGVLLRKPPEWSEAVAKVIQSKPVLLVSIVMGLTGSSLGIASVLGAPPWTAWCLFLALPSFLFRVALLDVRAILQLTKSFEWFFLMANFIVLLVSFFYLIPTLAGHMLGGFFALSLVPSIMADAAILAKKVSTP
jgi:hypothetical protein